MSGSTARRPHAEFMQVWEEGYVATTSSFVAMHMQGIAVFAGGALLGPGGELDRDAVREWLRESTRGIPYARLRLQRAPWGLTPPAWVPAEDFEIDSHVRFGDVDRLTPETMRRLIGWDEGPLDIAAPLWRLRVTPLDDGRVAVGILMHHAGGDALRTLKFLSSVTTSRPASAPSPAELVFGDERAPRRGGELALLALQDWWRASDTVAERWHEYRRKPILRRVRRVAVRMARPWRDRRPGPLAVHSASRTIAGAAVQSAAEAVDGTMNDLVVAAAIHAASHDGGAVRVRVPVLRRNTETSRNRVTDAEISGRRSPTRAELVGSVREQLTRARETPAPAPESETARPVGYATLVPWLSRSRYLLGARLEDVVVLPASLPDDELSLFALLYDNTLTVTITAPQTVPLDPILDDIEATLTESAPTSAPSSLERADE
jgi:diacylglycerol O-acyltransferase